MADDGFCAVSMAHVPHFHAGVRKQEINTPNQMQNTVWYRACTAAPLSFPRCPRFSWLQIDNVMCLRTYLDYHLKCSKSHLMSMMRTSCSKLLKGRDNSVVPQSNSLGMEFGSLPSTCNHRCSTRCICVFHSQSTMLRQRQDRNLHRPNILTWRPKKRTFILYCISMLISYL